MMDIVTPENNKWKSKTNKIGEETPRIFFQQILFSLTEMDSMVY